MDLSFKLKPFTSIFFIILLNACSNKSIPVSNPVFSNAVADFPDYTNLAYWAAHADKKDPSDSIPAPLRSMENEQLADVFFIHPTTFTTKDEDHAMNADINDALLNAKTDNGTILFQSSVFNNSSRIYAPRYRQAHLSAFYGKKDQAEEAFELAYTDLKKAFDYYLQHYNNGRPIIIAGHSQGAKMSEFLLKDYFENKPLMKQLVVAYIIGWPVPENYFSSIPFCRDSIQTGCVCSWRTFRKGYTPEFVEKETFKALTTNPLSWTSDETYAPSSQNKGSVLLKFNKVFKHTTDAQVHDNMLWVKKPRFPGGIFLRRKNYHIADINLFYMNIRKNAKDRAEVFLNGN
jgi:hypothetical protein